MLGVSTASAQDSAAFEKGLASVERAMDKGHWGKASSALTGLLEEHEEQPYVFLEKQRILQDMERIALFLKYESPSADDVLAGKVKKYDADKGKIEVVFSGADLSDFNASGNSFTLPVIFTGAYSIEMEGDIYPTSQSISVVTGWGGERCYYAHMGDEGHLPTIAWDNGDRNSEFLDTSAKQPMKLNMPFQFLVEVKSNKVLVKANKKKLMEAKRPKGDYGRFGFYGTSDYERESMRITLKGEVEPSWIAGKIDEFMEERRKEFEGTYVAEDHLPAWLFLDAMDADGDGPNSDADPGADEADSTEGLSLRDRARKRKDTK